MKNMKYGLVLIALIVLHFNFMAQSSIYSFKVETLEGEIFDFATLKNKKVMIVNTASQCGLTPQYEGLEELYSTYSKEDFVIIGFPANNFGHQEPGTNKEIASFCQKNYGVSFPMMSKISVKGDDQHELYKFLTQKKLNGLSNNEVQWNFQKYLIDKSGHLVEVLSPRVLPLDEKITNWIKAN
jgi:glutathione peroxidase